MTNEENLKSLSAEELAWFTMGYCGDTHCRTCVYKSYDECKEYGDDKLSCYEAHVEWLKRETASDKNDELMFHMCRQNVLVEKLNPYIEASNALTSLKSFQSLHEGDKDMSDEEYGKKYGELSDTYMKYAEKIGADENTDVYQLLEHAKAEYESGLKAIGGWK